MDNSDLSSTLPPVAPTSASPSAPAAPAPTSSHSYMATDPYAQTNPGYVTDPTLEPDPSMGPDPSYMADPALAADPTLPPPEMPASEPTPTPAPTEVQAPVPTQAPDPTYMPGPTLPPTAEEPMDAPMDDPSASFGILSDVAMKINESQNILVALSSNPSVDELAAAIGLSLFLDRLGKRATAIYSGTTPNALEFLKPEETFETTADALQDFVIALNKEKADHLRYRLDGDFVKIYITPYQTRISEQDLEFTYGDFNVDLVLALDVSNGIDLDAALREHGRIMHDASIVNITTGNPGKFGEIEWSDKNSSSVSEMVARLLFAMKGHENINKEEATAFLTGIIAATNRFENAATTPDTMKLASRLMESGANQQLIARNITSDIENELFNVPVIGQTRGKTDVDPTKLDIEHEGDEGIDETKIVDADVNEKESTLLSDLKAAEESLMHTGAEATPEETQAAFRIENGEEVNSAPEPPEDLEPEAPAEPPAKAVEEDEPVEEEVSTPSEPVEETPTELPPVAEKPADPSSEATLTPPPDYVPETLAEGTNKYGQMLEEALDQLEEAAKSPEATYSTPEEPNPAATNAPSVSSKPEINGVPEINYAPASNDAVLPPPPAPSVDSSFMPPESNPDSIPSSLPEVEPIPAAAPEVEPTPMPLGDQPAMQDQVYHPQASDPGAFKIPGM